MEAAEVKKTTGTNSVIGNVAPVGHGAATIQRDDFEQFINEIQNSNSWIFYYLNIFSSLIVGIFCIEPHSNSFCFNKHIFGFFFSLISTIVTTFF